MCVCVRVCAFMCLCVCVGMLDGYCAICVTLQSLLQVTQLNMVHAGSWGCLSYLRRTYLCWCDCANILIGQLLEDSCFPCIV